jgi:hypothetical protein
MAARLVGSIIPQPDRRQSEMFSSMANEMVCEAQMDEWRRVRLPACERRAWAERELRASRPTHPAGAWRAMLGSLGTRLVTVGERLRAFDAVTTATGA